MNPPHILILDDDQDVRAIVHTVAQEAVPSAEILERLTCREVLQDIAEDWPDLLITNCHMPEMDGPSLVRLLRDRKVTLPIIMVSASDDARALGEKAGVDSFIAKQRLTSQLPAAIHHLLPA